MFLFQRTEIKQCYTLHLGTDILIHLRSGLGCGLGCVVWWQWCTCGVVSYNLFYLIYTCICISGALMQKPLSIYIYQYKVYDGESSLISLPLLILYINIQIDTVHYHIWIHDIYIHYHTHSRTWNTVQPLTICLLNTTLPRTLFNQLNVSR